MRQKKIIQLLEPLNQLSISLIFTALSTFCSVRYPQLKICVSIVLKCRNALYCVYFNPQHLYHIFIPVSVYRYSKLAHGYLGNADRTESGKQCVLWNNTVFVEFYGLKASNFPDKEIPGAVCRNPQDQSLNKLGLTDKGPWCFTNYIEDSTYMDTCDLPLRGQLKSSQKVESGKYVQVLLFNQYLWVSITYMPNEKLKIFMRDFLRITFF